MSLAFIKRMNPSHGEVVHIYKINGTPAIDFCRSIFRHPELSFESVTVDIDTQGDCYPDTVRSVHSDEELMACSEAGMIYTVNALVHFQKKSVELIVHIQKRLFNICCRDEHVIEALKNLLEQ